jgi:tetratricopeptide (TPR) repeat protein
MFGGRRRQREIDGLQDLVNAHDAEARRMMPLGRWVEAYQHNSMALAAVFQLEQLDPGSGQHEPVLAAKLYNQATIARHVGDMRVALSSAKEAVEIYERLARRDPATYQTLLADARARLGLLTGVAGDRGTARALGGQAAQAYRDAATSDPEKEHDLAIFRRQPAPLAPSDQEAFGVAALMVAKASHDSGRDRDLHDAATDAVEHFRACFGRAPDDNAGWYAQSLALLACHHERQGDLAQARHAVTDAAGVLQRAPTASPGRPEAEQLIATVHTRLPT